MVEKTDALCHESVSPNEANTSSDLLSSETVVTPGGGRFPKRSQFGSRPSPRTKPTTVLPNEANGYLGRMGRENGPDRPQIGSATRRQRSIMMCLVPKNVIDPGWAVSQNEANDRSAKRSQWCSPEDGRENGRALPRIRFPERSQYQFGSVEFRNRRHPGRRPLPQTKPIRLAAISPNEANDRITKRSQWLSREDGSRKRARSP